MNPEYIEISEVLYRAVTSNPFMWKATVNRPSSAVFKDSHGASVDRDGGRTVHECCDYMETHLCFPLKAIISITAKSCEVIGVLPVPRATADNPFHAEIHESVSLMKISDKKARQLALQSQIVRTLPV